MWIFVSKSRTEIYDAMKATSLRELMIIKDLCCSWALNTIDAERGNQLGINHDDWYRVFEALWKVTDEIQTSLWDHISLPDDENASLGVLGVCDSFQDYFDSFPRTV